MRIGIIANPNSGSSEQIEALHGLIDRRSDITLMETQAPGDAEVLARRVSMDGFDYVVAAGGDGTVKEVANGLMTCHSPSRLAILPLGTGNDLARTLDVPADAQAAFDLIEQGKTTRIDVIEMQSGDRTVYGVNAAAGGFSGMVGEVLTAEMKSTWGPLAYVFGAAQILPDVTKYDMRIQVDDTEPETERVLNVIVANGRTIGGGRNVAPLANPEDGLLDVVIVHVGTVFQLADVGRRLLTGNYIDHPLVTLHRSKKVLVFSRPGMWFNIDGELFTNDPVTFSVKPAAIEVIVGPNYEPNPST